MGQFDTIFSGGTQPVDFSKNQFGSIFNDQEEFKRRQEEDRKRIESERAQREAEQVRKNRPLKEKIKEEVKMIVPTLKELPGVVKEAAPEFIKGAELGALQLATTASRTLSRFASTSAAKDLGVSQRVVERFDEYAKKDRASLETLQQEYAKGGPEEQKITNLNYLVRGLGQTLTTMVPAIGAGAAASILAVPTAVGSTVAAVTMAPLIFGEAWEQSKKAGKSDQEADLRASVTTVVIGALERIGLGRILKPSAAPTIVKRIIGRIGEAVPTEVLTENIQEFAEVAIGKIFGEDKSFKTALQSIPEVTVQTVLATMAFTGALGVTQRRIDGPNGMAVEEQEPEEIPFDPEALALAPVIEEVRQTVENSLPEVDQNELLATVVQQYDTPEAFIEAVKKGEIPPEYLKGIQNEPTVYRAGKLDVTKNTEQGISVTTDKSYADSFGSAREKLTEQLSISKDAKILKDIPKNLLEKNKDGSYSAKGAADLEFAGKDEFQNIVDYARKNGFDAVDLTGLNDIPGGKGEAEIRVLNPDILKTNDTDARLTEIYNKAKGPKDTSKTKDKVIEEMMQSFAGQRFRNEATGEYSGTKSTFPKWVPDDLRSTELFNKVIDDIEKGNLPRGGTKRAELYEIVRNEINKRNGSPEVSLEGVLLNKGEGKKEKLQSRVFERLQQENPEALEGDLEYNLMNMKKDAEKAVNLVASDLQKAYDIAMGNETSKDITSTAASIALSEKALVDGNHELYERLTRNRSLAQTRRGQEIVAEKGSITDNSTARYVKELISAKMDILGNKYLDTIKVGKKSTPKQRVLKAMEAEVVKAEKYVKSEKLTMKDAISLLDQLTCL